MATTVASTCDYALTASSTSPTGGPGSTSSHATNHASPAAGPTPLPYSGSARRDHEVAADRDRRTEFIRHVWQASHGLHIAPIRGQKSGSMGPRASRGIPSPAGPGNQELVTETRISTVGRGRTVRVSCPAAAASPRTAGGDDRAGRQQQVSTAALLPRGLMSTPGANSPTSFPAHTAAPRSRRNTEVARSAVPAARHRQPAARLRSRTIR